MVIDIKSLKIPAVFSIRKSGRLTVRRVDQEKKRRILKVSDLDLVNFKPECLNCGPV